MKDDITKPTIAWLYPPLKKTTGKAIQNSIRIRVIIMYMVKNCVLRKVDKIPSKPIVGNISNGTGENRLKANFKSGFFNNTAIWGEKINNNKEKMLPSKKNKFVSLLMRLFASLKGTLGKKKEKVLGSPKVNIVSNV